MNMLVFVLAGRQPRARAPTPASQAADAWAPVCWVAARTDADAVASSEHVPWPQGSCSGCWAAGTQSQQFCLP